MALLRTSLIALSIHLEVMFLRTCPLQILPLIKVYSQHYKICTLPNMKPLREIKMPSWNEYLCFWTDTFRTVNFIFTRLYLL